MMKKTDFIVLSSFDKLPLHATMYEPNDGITPKAVLQFCHGMCEHKGRYEELIAYFVERGYAAVMHDYRGHGETAQTQEDVGYFGDTTARAVVQDAVQITRYAKEKYPNLPVYLFGHSMGSMVVRCYLQQYDHFIDKLVVCGSPSQNPLAPIAIGLTKCIAFFKGERHQSSLLRFLSIGNGDKKFPGEGKDAWLSKNRESVEAYHADSKCGFTFTCNGFENLFRLLQNTYDKSLYQVKNPALPIFFVSGSDDPVMISQDKWLQSHAFLRSVGYENVAGKLYHGDRHEICNELDREKVYADLLAFFERG